MKIIERYKKAFEDYKTVRLLKKMFKPLGIEVQWKFIQHIKAPSILVEFWSIEHHTLIHFRSKYATLQGSAWLSDVIEILQNDVKQFMYMVPIRPRSSWQDDKTYYLPICNNPFLGCKSIEEMLIKADLMSK